MEDDIASAGPWRHHGRSGHEYPVGANPASGDSGAETLASEVGEDNVKGQG